VAHPILQSLDVTDVIPQVARRECVSEFVEEKVGAVGDVRRRNQQRRGAARPVLYGRTTDSENPTTSVSERHDTLGITRNSKSWIRYGRVNEVAGMAYQDR
jgi:hypothetical protein